MTKPVWTIAADWNGDKDFGDANEDITQHVMSARWSLGLKSARDYIARPATATLTVKNSTGLFSPGHSNAISGLQIGRSLKISSTHAGEAAVVLNQPGIGDGYSAALFDSTDTVAIADFSATGLVSTFTPAESTVIVAFKAPDADWWLSGNRQFLHLEYNSNNRIRLWKTGTTVNRYLQASYVAGGTTKLAFAEFAADTDWHVLAMTVSKTNDRMKMYVDGVQYGGTQTGLGVWGGGNLTIAVVGAQNASGTTPANATIAKCLVINGELTAAQVAAFDFPSREEPVLAMGAKRLSCSFSEAVDVTATDDSGNGYHGAYSTTTRTRTHFLGWIESIRPEANLYGTRRASIVAKGFMARAMDAAVFPQLQTDVTADEVMLALLADAAIYPPAAAGFWFLGETGQSELGTNTVLGAQGNYANLDAGASTFAYVFDNSPRSTSLYALMRQLMESEQGHVFADREGRVRMWSRHYFALDDSVAQSLTASDIVAANVDYGDVANEISNTFYPRLYEDAGPYVLGYMDNVVDIPPYETKTIRIRYRDSAGNSISTTDPITPVAGVDYVANRRPDGTGKDATSEVAVVASYSANSVEWTVASVHRGTLHIMTAQQRGNTRLTDFGSANVRVTDASSIATYGKHPEKMRTLFIDNDTEALSLAQWRVRQFGTPRTRLRSITLMPYTSDALAETALARTMGDRLSIAISTPKESWISDDYFIIGEEHVLSPRQDWQTTYHLRAADNEQFWILGRADYSELGQTTYIGA